MKRVVILGLGGGAGKILTCIATKSDANWIQLVHVDTDKEDQLYHERLHSETIANEWVSGQGCGGDSLLGENAIRSSIGQVRNIIKDSELLLVIACLGRGTGSGGVQAISRLVKEDNILTFFFTTFPFDFEGNSKRNVAESSLKTLRKNAEVVIAIQNDLLFTCLSADELANETFKQANQILADGVIGIAELVRCRGLLSIDFPSLKTVLSRKEAFCSFGVGQAIGDDKIKRVIENLFHSPMLGGKDFVDKADVVIATLIGGEDMSMGEMQQCLSDLNDRLNSTTKTIIGANVVSEKGDQLQISMLAIQFPKNHTKIRISGKQKYPKGAPIRRRGKRNFASTDSPYQLTLPFSEESHALGIFSDCAPTIYQGQNLDIPTYQRLGINLDLPET